MRFIKFLAAAAMSLASGFPLPRSQAPNFEDINAVVTESAGKHEFKQISLDDY